MLEVEVLEDVSQKGHQETCGAGAVLLDALLDVRRISNIGRCSYVWLVTHVIRNLTEPTLDSIAESLRRSDARLASLPTRRTGTEEIVEASPDLLHGRLGLAIGFVDLETQLDFDGNLNVLAHRLDRQK
jgi:hypothetical protein